MRCHQTPRPRTRPATDRGHDNRRRTRILAQAYRGNASASKSESARIRAIRFSQPPHLAILLSASHSPPIEDASEGEEDERPQQIPSRLGSGTRTESHRVLRFPNRRRGHRRELAARRPNQQRGTLKRTHAAERPTVRRRSRRHQNELEPLRRFPACSPPPGIPANTASPARHLP